ncbi:hypothetical protein GU927_010955 [Rhodobacteraceae bacterium HSP-20]|uniref:CDP-alcohol phosphatidyltransferase n=1 Tax=Paragemmobacter amnigenus TaxID=2852097 RepID=A0ABS6J3M1_9RHOB|nr:hypothetical protein [Rhodobacter amnigenus]MBU9698363.1 hypothetical protein [Rhodobacter amnigenus]MBV4389590.1 hypothetical protein [Rhodobacter amnigenus]
MTARIGTINRAFGLRMTGPGGLYNLGNAMGLLGGITLHIAATPQIGGGLGHGLEAALDYLAGSFGAAAITLSMLVFFWSGERYHRAWKDGAPPDPVQNRAGDISSGIGALLLGFGLFLMDQTLLAATAGLLHAAGKFGSALPAAWQRLMPHGAPAFRGIVLLSRLPAILLVLFEAQAAIAGLPAQPLAASAVLLLCYLIWLRADLMLMRS